jgi:DNA-directed RNA polymerase specialized sigma24 family protein
MDTSLQFEDGSIGRDVLTKRKNRDRISAADALIVAQYHARLVTHAGNWQDVEDVAQDAIVSVLTNSRKPAMTPGLLATTARTARAHQTYALAGLRHEDVAGRNDLNAAVEAAEMFEHRIVSAAERAEMAAMTRDTWKDVRHKPRIGFEQRFRNVPLEDSFDDAEAIPSAEPVEAERHTAGHALVDAVESGKLSRDKAYLHVWDAFAAEAALPVCARASLDSASAAGAKRAVGEPAGTAKAIVAGVAAPHARAAFFAPFGDLDDRQRANLVTAIAERPDYGGKLWQAALDAATTR